MDSSPLLFAHSPYLTHLARQWPDVLRQAAETGTDAYYRTRMETLRAINPHAITPPELMQRLRRAKAEIALLTAVADIGGEWPLEKVTHALSEFAEASLRAAVGMLLARAAGRGEITLPQPDAPPEGSGFIVLGMGKLGAHELNYSSDIDLILLYERGRLNYAGRQDEQKFMNKLAHDLVQIMQERTPQGYVFRTDLRLRPDPASTPPVVNTEAALAYYESVGQNWERAAMIKARPLAGDIAAGEEFLRGIAPFMWRRNLDFAAIQDIHSIKRQMDSRAGRELRVPGHNVKIGPGGIREIEFFVQIHQLIWGGREPALRLRGTCEALARLAALGLVEERTARALTEHYGFLRRIEHRLQMIADQQTHTVPEAEAELARVALFSGFPTVDAFSEALLSTLRAVHGVFSASFQSSEVLGDQGNLVFTGVSHDPDTLSTLSAMGYHAPETVSETVMGWHHGARRATRTKRAREQLTELMPVLLKRLSATADPDAAFLKFDEFLGRMPAGVQLFSLFTAYPQLLDLIADIMGSAPVLAETLSRHPDLLEAVLYGDFYGALPTREALNAQLADMLEGARDFEECMETLRRFKNERQFQAGVQLLRGLIDARASGRFLSLLAEVILACAVSLVGREFERAYGRIAGGEFCVICLGKLGSEEMTFGSDIDIVFTYDAPDSAALSDGEKGFSAGVYYNRLSQRLLGALTAMGKEGRLYEADTRLRPSGSKGPSAASFSAVRQYFDESAWTFEFMALTKARPVAGDAALAERLRLLIRAQLEKPRDAEKLRADVAEMRERVAREFPAVNLWDLKYARGGLVDVDFLCQYLLLRHAAAQPRLTEARSSEAILRALHSARLLDAETTAALLRCNTFLVQLLNLMRLCLNTPLDESSALPGLKRLLSGGVGMPDFPALKEEVIAVEKTVREIYRHLLAAP